MALENEIAYFFASSAKFIGGIVKGKLGGRSPVIKFISPNNDHTYLGYSSDALSKDLDFVVNVTVEKNDITHSGYVPSSITGDGSLCANIIGTVFLKVETLIYNIDINHFDAADALSAVVSGLELFNSVNVSTKGMPVRKSKLGLVNRGSVVNDFVLSERGTKIMKAACVLSFCYNEKIEIKEVVSDRFAKVKEVVSGGFFVYNND